MVEIWSTGQLLPGANTEGAHKALESLLPNASPEQRNQFSAGVRFVVSSVATQGEAQSIVDALRQAGFDCHVGNPPLQITLKNSPKPAAPDNPAAKPGAAEFANRPAYAAVRVSQGLLFFALMILVIGIATSSVVAAVFLFIPSLIVVPSIRDFLHKRGQRPSTFATSLVVLAGILVSAAIDQSSGREAEQKAAANQMAQAAQAKKQLAAEAVAAFRMDPKPLLAEVQQLISEGKFSQAQVKLSPLSKVDDPGIKDLLAKVKSGLADAAKAAKDAALAAKISPTAVSAITPSGSPKIRSAWGDAGIARLNRLQPLAARKVAESNKCDRVEVVGFSSDRSSPKEGPVFFVDCKNEDRFYVTQADIEGNRPVKSKKEIMQALSDVDVIMICESGIKVQLNYPLSFDRDIMNTSVTRAQKGSGNIAVNFTFSAKNGFGAELPQAARCVFDDRGIREASIFNS